MTVHKRIPEEDYELLKKEYRSKEELQTMIVEAILKEEDEIRKEEGKKEGIIAQRLTLFQLLQYRFPTSAEESETYTAYLAQIENLDHLTQLVNQLLIALTLADFEQKLLSYLPKDEEQE